MPEHPIFHDGADQLVMLTNLLDSFPGQKGNPDVRVPIHPRVREAWAKELIKRGVVVLPELMKELPVPAGDHPEAGWLQPMRWIKKADWERLAEQEASPETAGRQQEQARQMLAAIDPDLEAKIAAMSDPEKRAEMARMATEVPRHLDAVRLAQEHIEKARRSAKEDNDG